MIDKNRRVYRIKVEDRPPVELVADLVFRDSDSNLVFEYDGHRVAMFLKGHYPTYFIKIV